MRFIRQLQRKATKWHTNWCSLTVVKAKYISHNRYRFWSKYLSSGCDCCAHQSMCAVGVWLCVIQAIETKLQLTSKESSTRPCPAAFPPTVGRTRWKISACNCFLSSCPLRFGSLLSPVTSLTCICLVSDKNQLTEAAEIPFFFFLMEGARLAPIKKCVFQSCLCCLSWGENMLSSGGFAASPTCCALFGQKKIKRGRRLIGEHRQQLDLPKPSTMKSVCFYRMNQDSRGTR